jgi:hypothetical protein
MRRDTRSQSGCRLASIPRGRSEHRGTGMKPSLNDGQLLRSQYQDCSRATSHPEIDFPMADHAGTGSVTDYKGVWSRRGYYANDVLPSTLDREVGYGTSSRLLPADGQTRSQLPHCRQFTHEPALLFPQRQFLSVRISAEVTPKLLALWREPPDCGNQTQSVGDDSTVGSPRG